MANACGAAGTKEAKIVFTTKARRTRRFRKIDTPNFVLFVSFVVKKKFSICCND